MEKEKILELLENADWEEIILKLTRYSYWQANKYTWQTKSNIDLTRGKTPKDIALEAIKKVWEGTRAWNPDKYPDLLTHLKWIVKSDLQHLWSSLEHRKTERTDKYNENSRNIEDIKQTSTDAIPQIHGHVSSPLEIIDKKEKEERFNKIKSRLDGIVKDDEDLEMLLLCLEEDIYKPKNIAKETGWDISKVYNLKRKLKRRAHEIKDEFIKGR